MTLTGVLGPSSYLLCGTPRTGSTYLCSLLASTGALGRPESYFREPDEARWARRLGVPVVDGRAQDYQALVQAVRGAGTTENGVFGARVMWGSLGRLVTGLHGPGTRPDLAVLEQAWGPVALVFLRRHDVVEQAVSWCRAEQTGFWQQGDSTVRPPRQDLVAMKHFHGLIGTHNNAWRSWFDRQGAVPIELSYEQVVQDPRRTVQTVADRLHVTLPATWEAVSPHRRQADAVNREWAAALRAVVASDPG